MRVACTSDDRSLILRVMQKELGEAAVYHGLPDFSYSVGSFELLRSGDIETDSEDLHVIRKLASLGLCEHPDAKETLEGDPVRQVCKQAPAEETPLCRSGGDVPAEERFVWQVQETEVSAMMNLICMISARQRLLNRALDSRKAFFVSEKLMKDLLFHTPASAAGFLQHLYGREEEFRGICFSGDSVSLPGFFSCREEERSIHQQLAERMISTARKSRWIKPFMPEVRNKKYVFKVWLYAIGMAGPAYEEARRILLSRLPGRADRRPLRRGKEV